MIKKVKDNNLVLEGNVQVIDFNATWCGPCRMLAPIIDEISEEMPEINFYNVDVDDNRELAYKFNISSIPALVIMKNGEKQEVVVGFTQKQRLVDILKKYL